ncbi:hypothetical protein [Candidatus Hamiltonella defensa]|uniref:hypothetical protein n=1 Tax=Candidatus Williamhamiltonella defendens TaxID=138072 RepID=UPI0030D84B61
MVSCTFPARARPRLMWRMSRRLIVFILHGEEESVHGDAGDKGVVPRSEHQHRRVTWHITRRRVLALPRLQQQVDEKHQHHQNIIAKIRAKVEHPFRVLKWL